jgi:hypothetical protein
MSNGVLLKNIEKDLEFYRMLDIGFGITTYPGKTDMETFNKLS